MGEISIISTSIVKAESPNKEYCSTQSIELTPWDLHVLLIDYNQKGLLFHKPGNFSEHIKGLKTSLSRALDFFPPLAGRLATMEHDDNNLSFYINCNNAGAIYIHAKARGVTLSDIADALYVPPLVHSFFPLQGVPNYKGTSEPLLAVQVTELEDGVFIGYTMNHAVADGTSFWHFLNSWSEICRGSDSVSKPPHLQRWFLDGTNALIRIPFPNTHDCVQVFKEKLIDNINIPAAVPLQKERIFHFSRENIAQLKAKANAEMETQKTNREISSLQALLAHLWCSIIRGSNGHLDPDRKFTYGFLIGARPRMNPPLTQHYFGNALQEGKVTLEARDLLEKGLGFVAGEMNKMVALYTEEKLKNFLEGWVQEPELLQLEKLSGDALVTSSCPWFDVYGNDFGWGKPVGVRTGAANKGLITVFAGAEEGSIDIEACLLAETLEAMGNDSEFMDAVRF